MDQMVLIPVGLAMAMQERIVQLENQLRALQPHVCKDCAEAEMKAQRDMETELRRFRLIRGPGFIMGATQ